VRCRSERRHDNWTRAHFAEFATLVRRNSPPCFAGFGRVLGGRDSGRRRASTHPLILTSFELRLSA
jgi:hypothetical protein